MMFEKNQQWRKTSRFERTSRQKVKQLRAEEETAGEDFHMDASIFFQRITK